MLDTRVQLRVLLQRAAELRVQSDEIQRKLREILAEIAKLGMRGKGLGPRDHPSDRYPPRTPLK